MRTNTPTTCIIDAAELIFDHLYSDLTIGDLYFQSNFRQCISILERAKLMNAPLAELMKKQPNKNIRMLESVLESIKGISVYQEEVDCLYSILLETYEELSFKCQSSCPSQSSRSQLFLSVVA